VSALGAQDETHDREARVRGRCKYADDSLLRAHGTVPRACANTRGLGFSLTEIRELLGLRVHDPRSCGAVTRRVDEKIDATERKIRELQALQRALEQLRASCAARERTADCPILEALVDDA
jgi:hypothetical protein